MAANAENLGRLQRWFHAAITDPAGTSVGLQSDIARQLYPDADERLDDVVLPSKTLNSMDRLSIYANMYFDRLIDILAEEFPSVRHLLGPDIFADIVTGYVTQHPSTHYSLSQLGKEFPQYLSKASEKLPNHNCDFVAAVATVERTMEDVFDEQQDDPLGFEDIQAIGPECWDRVRLKTVSALRLLRLPYPVNDCISAVRDGHEIGLPEARPSHVVVHRRNYRVWRTDIDEQQFMLLRGLREGRPLGEAISICVDLPGIDADVFAASLYNWFRTWSVEGYFRSMEIVGLAEDEK